MSHQIIIDPPVAESFAKQGLMHTLGARMIHAHDGRATIEILPADSISQQHGFIHAGAIASIADSACGYAAMSITPSDRAVLTVEFKITLLAPAKGDRFQAIAKIIRPGRKLHFAQADVYAFTKSNKQLIAQLTATITTVNISNYPDKQPSSQTPQ